MSLFPKGGKVLDIGCGRGTELYMQGVTPFGIEISRDLAVIANERMKQHGGFAIQAPAIDGLKQFEDGSFDGVIMNSYLEHEEQPREALREVARVLRSGGKAYVRVPNYGGINRRVTGRKWCGFRYPDHVNYFTLSGLRSMAREASFTTSLVNWLTLPTDDNIKMVLTRP
jgi:SAM-dependent methyltransferase